VGEAAGEFGAGFSQFWDLEVEGFWVGLVVVWVDLDNVLGFFALREIKGRYF
jgi:hypothetical protein